MLYFYIGHQKLPDVVLKSKKVYIQKISANITFAVVGSLRLTAQSVIQAIVGASSFVSA